MKKPASPPSGDQPGKSRKRRKKPVRVKSKPRATTVGVRLTKDELTELKVLVQAHGLKRSVFLRAVWLGLPLPKKLPETLGPAAWPARVLSAAELVAYRQLVEVARRLNEVAELPEATDELRAEAHFLFEQLRYLLAELVPPRTERRPPLQ